MTSSPAADPSMEQILASIRQSIADIGKEARGQAAVPSGPVQPPRQAVAAAPRPAAQPAASARSSEPTVRDDAVVELRPRPVEDDAARAPAPNPAATSAPQPSYNYTLRREGAARAQRAQPRPSAGQAPQPATQPAQPPIMSAEADASVTRAFNGLANTLLSNEARTLEDLVRELLRPMLKNWLDDNLPPLVERLVREEIERVARGQRQS